MSRATEFWMGRKHGDHRDAPPWLIAFLIAIPSLVIGLFFVGLYWLGGAFG